MGFIGYRSDGADERRIGNRAPAEPLAITWVVPRSGGFSLRKNHRLVPGAVRDVSLTGAAILGPSEIPFEIGATVLIRYEGHDCSVIVRRRQSTDDPAVDLFGVEMIVVHPKLKREIQRRLSAVQTPDGEPAPGR
jgi:hypothetical protein